MSGSVRPSMVHVSATAGGHVFLVASACDRSDPAAAAGQAYADIADALRKENLCIVQERIFGSLSDEAVVRSARHDAMEARGVPSEGPLTYIEGRPAWGAGWAGSIIHAVRAAESGQDVVVLRDDAGCRGTCWQHRGRTFVILQCVRSPDARHRDPSSRAAAAGGMIRAADSLLRSAGMTFRDVVRTWYYLTGILQWYREFNHARTAEYQALGLLPGASDAMAWLPASTGIEGVVRESVAGALDLLAVAGGSPGEVRVERLASPLQPEATAYGSAFARAVAIHDSESSLIELSGTAAVDRNGHTLYPGNARAQMEYTLDAVAAVLAQGGATMRNVAAATAFVKHPSDAEWWREVVAARGLQALPAVCVIADICRPDLLFELDAEAVCSR
jgi:enamine deaminase RidA (YjgF/YER057c/UK114 family)